MAFYLGDRSPSNLYVYDFATQATMTNSLLEINANDLVEAENISYKSFDGIEIPAILYNHKRRAASIKYRLWSWCMAGGGQARRLQARCGSG